MLIPKIHHWGDGPPPAPIPSLTTLNFLAIRKKEVFSYKLEPHFHKTKKHEERGRKVFCWRRYFLLSFCRDNVAEKMQSQLCPTRRRQRKLLLQNICKTFHSQHAACGKGGGGAASMGIKDFQSRDFLRILGPKTTLWRQPHPPQFVSRAPTKCLFITNINQDYSSKATFN